MANRLLPVCIALTLLALSAGTQEGGEAESEVPAALEADCTWSRRDDYSKPRTVSTFEETFKPFTEERCKEECAKRVICGYANFKNRTRECQLIPRRAFHESYRAKQGLYVMWEKKCPIEHIWNRTDDPAVLVMCPMTKPSDRLARLSPKYAYRVAKWLDETEAAWWCQRDPLCQAIYKNTTSSSIHVFLYKAEFTENTDRYPTILKASLKNCTKPSGPMIGEDCWFTAYNHKVVNGTVYKTVKYKNFRECYAMCEAAGETCYAAEATEDSYRRGYQRCKLYHKEDFHGMKEFGRIFDNSKVWVRNVCKEDK